ncbi:MAG: hypothetical protein WC799_18255 [Desulfobacteraceae bacterium]|jgi:hypothetical protein
MKNFRTFLAIIVISCIVCLTGCSSDDDLNPIIGTWSNSYDDGNCIESADLIISEDGSFDISEYSNCEIGGDSEVDASGTWEIANGLLYIYLTYSSDLEEIPTGVEIPLYYFITSTGKLSITDEEDIYERDGSGTGIVGAWFQENGECDLALTIYANGTYDYEDCEEESEGTFVTSGDRMTIDVGTEDEEVKYFKVFGNYVVITDTESLFTRQ